MENLDQFYSDEEDGGSDGGVNEDNGGNLMDEEVGKVKKCAKKIEEEGEIIDKKNEKKIENENDGKKNKEKDVKSNEKDRRRRDGKS